MAPIRSHFHFQKVTVAPIRSHRKKVNFMEKEKRALSWQEFVDSGFNDRDYEFPDFEGTYEATIACKRWDKNRNLLAYLDFDDGRKIMTSAWSEKNYLGLADIPLNTRVSVSFQFSAKGISYLRSVEVI